ncbi:hypothetical protein Airi01_038390 [Actinoallomurus iriomotensis]|uniref:ABC transporter domain-containing protein n=1 Tax=Actinoallomurus iriomotensis TaxID=478107 RepID=A0A9W6RKA0_9ACTN|nr:hypothetical protein Airi01_038390 [Actinoallomurus iriomotensis]
MEIARVLSLDVRILIMDEPTSALSNAEVDVLFEVLDDLRTQNVTIIYISHKLDEFRRIGDYVTVLRDGGLVAEAPMSRTDTGWIVQQMVGRSQASLFTRPESEAEGVLLEVEGLTVPGYPVPLVDDVGVHVKAGEIVGIYGLMGAGRTELMEALMGLRRHTAAAIRVAGRQADDDRVSGRLALGLALVPEDRQRDGLVQALSVRANVLPSTPGRLTRHNTGFSTLGIKSWLGVPVAIWIMVLVAAVAVLITTRTPFGRRVYAVGGNERAAELAGIRTSHVKIAAYVISGVCAALAGLILTSELGAAYPDTATTYELNAHRRRGAGRDVADGRQGHHHRAGRRHGTDAGARQDPHDHIAAPRRLASRPRTTSARKEDRPCVVSLAVAASSASPASPSPPPSA